MNSDMNRWREHELKASITRVLASLAFAGALIFALYAHNASNFWPQILLGAAGGYCINLGVRWTISSACQKAASGILKAIDETEKKP